MPPPPTATTSSTRWPSIPESEDADRKVAAPAPPSASASASATPAAAAAAGTAAPVTPAKKQKKKADPREAAFLLKHARPVDRCPISQALLTDPIIASDGITYQKAALEAYAAEAQAAGEMLRSPVTGEPIASIFFPNVAVRRLVEQYADAKRAEWRQLQLR